MGQGADSVPDYDDPYDDYEWRANQRRKDRESRENHRAFKKSVQSEVEKQLKRQGIEPKKYEPRGKMVDRVCACGCGATFQAREADVKRGWGKFSSKACAAKFKDRSTRGRNREYYGT